MSNDSHFVSPHGDDWSVQRSNSERPSHVFNTQREAIDRAREISRNQGTELRIQGADGRIRQCDRHGKDPRRTKG